MNLLTLKAPVMTQQTTFINIFSLFFREHSLRLDVSSESSATCRQMIHTKNQALFSSKDKSKKFKMPSAAIFLAL